MSFLDQFHHAAADGHAKADVALQELSRQSDYLARLVEYAEADTYRDRYRRIPLAGNADNNGNCTFAVPVPQGIAWDLVSITGSGAPATANTGMFVYLNSNDPANLIHVLTYATRMSDLFAGQEYVPQGALVVVEFVGQPAGQYCTANLKVQNLKEG